LRGRSKTPQSNPLLPIALQSLQRSYSPLVQDACQSIFTKSPCKRWPYPPPRISSPASSSRPCPFPKHPTASRPHARAQILSSRPEWPAFSAAPSAARRPRSGGTAATNQPKHSSISKARPSTCSHSPHLFAFLILPIHFSSCGNSFFHLTLHFPSRYLYIVRDVHSQNANLAFSAPNQGDSCPLNCAIFFP
jgi:hypothetical protein